MAKSVGSNDGLGGDNTLGCWEMLVGAAAPRGEAGDGDGQAIDGNGGDDDG